MRAYMYTCDYVCHQQIRTSERISYAYAFNALKGCWQRERLIELHGTGFYALNHHTASMMERVRAPAI